MTNPITAVRQKIEDHKTKIGTAAGFVAGTATTVIVIKYLAKQPYTMVIPVERTVDEFKAMLDETKSIDLTNAVTGNRIVLLTKDFKPE